MFGNFDDPVPPPPGPLDDVVARGRRLRARRRAIAGAAVVVVLAGGIATAVAVQDGPHRKVVVSTPSSTTTVSDTTVPESTSTSAPESTTTSTECGAPTFCPPKTPSTATSTTTTQAPHDPHDLSMVSVTWPADTISQSPGCAGSTTCENVFSLPAGTDAPVTYTVTNRGSWAVELGECVYHYVDVWTVPATAGWPPFTDGIWPQPYPTRGTGAAPTVCADVATRLVPGASVTRTETIVSGYRDAAGNLMPAPPGYTSFQPSFLPQCAQPCDVYPPGSIAVTVIAPQTNDPLLSPDGIYKLHLVTMHPRAASGASAPVELTYTNPLAFAVRMPVFGPCWTVKSGSAKVDCSKRLPAIIVGPHETVDLVGTIWARKGFAQTGAPLAAGEYKLDLGELQGSLGAGSDLYPYLTVTA
jgi:hypothetical protein